MTITIDIGGGQVVEFPDVETAQAFMANRAQPAGAPEGMVFNPATGQMTSRELLANHLQQQGVSNAESALIGGAQGVTFGGADEALGAISAAIPTGGTMGQRYEFGREYGRALADASRAENPIIHGGAEIAGAMAVPVGAAAGAGRAINTGSRVGNAAATIGGSAAATGALSGIYGFLSGEGGFGERLDDAKGAAALGAGIGAAIPVLGGSIQKAADALKRSGAIRRAVRSAPSSEQLRQIGRQLYQQVDDAGVQVRADRVRDTMTGIGDDIRGEGLKFQSVAQTMPASRAAMGVADEIGGMTTNTVPFSELDVARRAIGNAAGSNLANAGDTRIATRALSTLDDFVENLGPNDVDAGDIQALQTALPKARETWARMSRSQLLDDAVDNAADYRTGLASGLRAQFQRIVKNPKLSRGFSEAEMRAMRRVVNGTLPEQIVNYLGSGLGMMAQIGGGAAAGFAGGGPLGAVAGTVAGTALAGGSRKLAERIVSKNAEIARALVASGQAPAIEATRANPQIRQIIERLLTQATPAMVQ